ncbi:flagellar biosynthesis anti-sigma factor FlgM [Oceanobacillus manasiensis]|uniref:flagellar biosynthesis anti-sigma factor FlgM n=1 Tax=Oceanobacillus manasiensis TaxID=586413 RepID=UPI0005A6E52F|nr:flagellar biosynthesis anti-sigma factor FlgM [Oceanobacillus manasiensis]
MKINGPNQTNFNPYKSHLQKHTEIKKETKQDQLEISNQAKQLQEGGKTSPERAEYIQNIKKAVDAGEYKVDAEKTAQKMIDFWAGK